MRSTRLPAVLLALGLLGACSSGDDTSEHSGHHDQTASEVASAAPAVVALDLTFDDGTTGVAQILAGSEGEVTVQVALPDVIATAIAVRLSATDIEGIDLDLTEGAGGVWSGRATLVDAAWDLTVESTRDDDGFLSTATAVTSFDLPLQENR